MTGFHLYRCAGDDNSPPWYIMRFCPYKVSHDSDGSVCCRIKKSLTPLQQTRTSYIFKRRLPAGSVAFKRRWHTGHQKIQILLETPMTHSELGLTKADILKSWFGSLLLCAGLWACMCASAVLLSSQHLLHGNCCLEVYNVHECFYACVRERKREWFGEPTVDKIGFLSFCRQRTI